jgi:hypothetical protein
MPAPTDNPDVAVRMLTALVAVLLRTNATDTSAVIGQSMQVFQGDATLVVHVGGRSFNIEVTANNE